MRYKFNEFIFNSDSLVLTKGEESIEIRHNEAKLLALLLENSQRVLTKEEILSEVWQGKVVSEQAVFQNISNLRNLFGSSAIKTFPKRGYQWQLELEVIPSKSSDQKAQSINTASVKKPVYTRLAALLLAALIAMVLAYFLLSSEESSGPEAVDIAYLPITNVEGQTVIQLTDNQFNITQVTDISQWHYMAAIEEEYRKLSSKNPIVLSGQMREHNNLFYLDFLLKGPAGDWSGYLSAESYKLLNEKLVNHLQHKFIYQLINEPHSYELQQATLSLAHQQSPDDFIILGKLIDVYKIMGEHEKAMVLAEKLEAQAVAKGDLQQLGTALLYQSDVLYLKKLYQPSLHKLELAKREFQQIEDLLRQADVWDVKSKLAHAQSDYAGVKQSLLKSAELAAQAKDVERELHALTYLSVLAHKFKENEDKYLFLTQAERKMREYQLPQYRFAKIPFHYAIYTQSEVAKEPHLKRVLEFTELTPDHWVAQSSRQQLMKFYLTQERMTEAQALVVGLTSDNAENSYLKTLLASAKGEQTRFIQQAKKTFEQAELTGDKTISLNVALMLCEQPREDINFEYYSQYIIENATPYWRRANERKLLALNL